jgi:hypothetical protein
MPKEAIIYGVDTHMNPELHNKLSNLLKIPFQSAETFVLESKK